MRPAALISALGSAFTIIAALTICTAGCTESEPTPPACSITIDQALERVGAILPPFYAGLPEAAVYPDNTRADEGLKGRVVDITPLNRDAHRVTQWFFDPQICGLTGSPVAFAGAAPGAPIPTATILGAQASPTATVRGLLITGNDLGGVADAVAWSQVFATLQARLTHQHRPTVDAADTAITALCQGAGSDTSVIFMLSGRGVSSELVPDVQPGSTIDGLAPGPIAKPLFELDTDRFVSYSRLASRLATACSTAGLVVIIVDAGSAGDNFRELPVQPLIVWQASDPLHTVAPLAEPLGPGLLTSVLAPAVSSAIEAACLGAYPPDDSPVARTINPTPDELALAWKTSSGAVVKGMRDRRLALLAQGENTETTLATLLTEDVPSDIFRQSNVLPPGARCETDEDCEAAFSGCDADPCGSWRCQASRCLTVPSAGACDDGNPCTTSDTCLSGECVGTPADCDDQNTCTTDVCDAAAGGCQNYPLASAEPCSDSDACTLDDTCGPGGVCAGTPIPCDDENPCTEDSCNGDLGECTHAPAGGTCDDGDLCTAQDFCVSGVCVGVATPCDDGDPCTADTCDGFTGSCLAAAKPAGATCDDGDFCTLGDRCEAGECVGMISPCDDGLTCTADVCDSDTGQCAFLPAPNTCVAASGCVAVGEALPDDPCTLCASTGSTSASPDGTMCASDGVACTDDICIGGICAHPNLGGTCQTADGECVAVGTPLSACLVCGATGTGVAAAPGTLCDDGDPCTNDDVCTTSGVCDGALEVCCDDAVGPPVVCGQTLSGTTTGGKDTLNSYTCNGNMFTGPEAYHQFTAPCAGQAIVTFSADPNVYLILVRGDLDSCANGTCQSATPVGVYPTLAEGELVTLVVDGINGASGEYAIDIACGCP